MLYTQEYVELLTVETIATDSVH